MTKTSKSANSEARRGPKRSYFTRAISKLLQKRREEVRHGKFREIKDAAELRPTR